MKTLRLPTGFKVFLFWLSVLALIVAAKIFLT